MTETLQSIALIADHLHRSPSSFQSKNHVPTARTVHNVSTTNQTVNRSHYRALWMHALPRPSWLRVSTNWVQANNRSWLLVSWAPVLMFSAQQPFANERHISMIPVEMDFAFRPGAAHEILCPASTIQSISHRGVDGEHHRFEMQITKYERLLVHYGIVIQLLSWSGR